jgi:hypothetical protein
VYTYGCSVLWIIYRGKEPHWGSSWIERAWPRAIAWDWAQKKIQEDPKRGSFQVPNVMNFLNFRSLPFCKIPEIWDIKFKTFCIGRCIELHWSNLTRSL